MWLSLCIVEYCRLSIRLPIVQKRRSYELHIWWKYWLLLMWLQYHIGAKKIGGHGYKATWDNTVCSSVCTDKPRRERLSEFKIGGNLHVVSSIILWQNCRKSGSRPTGIVYVMLRETKMWQHVATLFTLKAITWLCCNEEVFLHSKKVTFYILCVQTLSQRSDFALLSPCMNRDCNRDLCILCRASHLGHTSCCL